MAVTTESLSERNLFEPLRRLRRILGRSPVPAHAWIMWGFAATLSFAWGVVALGIAVALSETSPMWWMVLPFATVPAVAVLVTLDKVVRHFAPRGDHTTPKSSAVGTATNGSHVDLSSGPGGRLRAPAVVSAGTEGRNGGPLLVDDLTDREREVLALLSTGRTNGEIAGELFVANGTIKSHVNSICRKLGARNRTEAVARAREVGLVP